MRFLKYTQATALFLFTLFFGSITVCGQTLEHRPPAKPVVPGDNSAAATHPLPGSPVLPSGTSLQVEITRPYPMKAGETIEGRLVYPLYIDGKLAVPENTIVHGTVTALDPDTKERWHGRLMGDFTPFHDARVQFNELVLPDGTDADYHQRRIHRSHGVAPRRCRGAAEAVAGRTPMGAGQGAPAPADRVLHRSRARRPRAPDSVSPASLSSGAHPRAYLMDI